jgi:hypothetical protein
MPAPKWLARLRCPRCGPKGSLKSLAKKKGDFGAWGLPGLKCGNCSESYPVIKGGILRMIPKGDYSRYAYWEKLHAGVGAKETVAKYRLRFGMDKQFLDNYFCLPRITRKAGWGPYASSLELGCGWGIYSMSLAQAGLIKDIWLLDISTSALKGTQQVFRAFGYDPYLIQADIHALPFKDKAFDVSLSGGLYEHFVGEEQQALVDENCRISRKILNELPEGSLTYWIYRKFFTWKWGGWPFGFEVPLSRSRLKELYEKAGARILAWDYHNLVSALLLVQAEKRPWLQRLTWRPFFLYALRHDVVVAVDTAKAGEK